MKTQFLRFVGTGLLNTLVGYCIYGIFVFFELAPAYALFGATLFGAFFNYVTLQYFVFNEVKGNFLSFLLSYAVIYAINLLILKGVLYFVTPSAYLAQLLSLVPTAIVAYLILKNYSFQKRFSHAKEAH